MCVANLNQKLVYPTVRVYFIMSGISRCVALVVRVAQGSCQAGDQVCCRVEDGTRGERGILCGHAGCNASPAELSREPRPCPAQPLPFVIVAKEPKRRGRRPKSKGLPSCMIILALVESLTLPLPLPLLYLFSTM